MDPLTFAKLWMFVKPIRRVRLAIAKRRARKQGLPEPTTLDEENVVFPQGTMTKSGIVIMALGGVISISLTAMGVGECTPEQVATGCVGATAIGQALTQGIGAIVGAVGSIIAWKGRNRVGK